MSDLEINVNSLYGIALREIENDTTQEQSPNLYQAISEFLGKLKREEYDNVEGKIKKLGSFLVYLSFRYLHQG